MATGMRFGVLLIKSCNYAKTTLLTESQLASRALTNLEITRGRRRTCRPAPWFMPKKTHTSSRKLQALTAENKEFLDEVVGDVYAKKPSPLKDGPWERGEYDQRTKRTGVLGIKIGVFPQWSVDGKKFHTTLLQVVDNHVINYVPPGEFNAQEHVKPHWTRYGSVVVGALSSDPMLYSKGYNNLFAKAGVPPKRKLTRFLVTPNAAIAPGTPLFASHFRVGDYVDVQAKTIGHGFQGVVKRWGMKGGPASHGATKFHRKMGSTGGGGDKSGIWKGKKMPGHMGMDWVHHRGLKIWRINTKYNILYLHGTALPGPTHCYVRIFDSSLPKSKILLQDNHPHMPTYYPDEHDALPEEIFDEKLHQFTEPSVVYTESSS